MWQRRNVEGRGKRVRMAITEIRVKKSVSRLQYQVVEGFRAVDYLVLVHSRWKRVAALWTDHRIFQKISCRSMWSSRCVRMELRLQRQHRRLTTAINNVPSDGQLHLVSHVVGKKSTADVILNQIEKHRKFFLMRKV